MDELRKKSDKELEKMEKKLSKIYKTAQKEISEKWNEYMEQAAQKLASLEKAYADAKASGDPDLIHKTGFELGKEKKLQTVQNERFKAMAKETAERLTNVNQMALDYVNDQMPKIYTMNYNETLGEIETEVGKVGVSRSFSLMDENTAKNLVKSDTSLFPQKVIDRAKDEKWNLKAINSQVLQGLLQGESIDKISARLQNVTDMNSAAAVRNARTMTTAAENNGRMSGMKEAEEKGIVYEKQWMATHDDRTRESHAELDGVSVGLDEDFPNGLQYPGDPAGDPEEVYNCRCSMVRKLIGFRRKDGSISEVDIEDEYKPTYFDTPFEKASSEELPESFKVTELIGGKGDPEVTDNIRDYFLPKATRDKLSEIEKVNTYNDAKSYLKENYGIELDTGLESLKTKRADDTIEAVKEQSQKVITAIDAYRETFGDDALSSLKKVVFYDQNLDVRAAYFFNRVGEDDPLAGEIHFSQWGDDGRNVFHELAHAFQDSHAQEGEDAVTYSERVIKELNAEGLSAYSGASSEDYAAEQFADAFGFAFSQGSKAGMDFIRKVEELEKKEKKNGKRK